MGQICNKYLTINGDQEAMIIDSDVNNLDFDTIRKETKSECNNLASIHDQIELLINDPMYHIHEEIEDLRNKAQLKFETLQLQIDDLRNKDQLKYDRLWLQIDKKFERCLNNLDIYENECKEKLRLANLGTYKNSLKCSQEELDSWLKNLNR